MPDFQTLNQIRGGSEYLDYVDVDIAPLMSLINSLPGCATLECCASKGPHGSKISEEIDNHWSLPYVLMVCRSVESGLMLASITSTGTSFNYQKKGMVLSNDAIVFIEFKSFEKMKEYETELRKTIEDLKERRLFKIDK